MANSEKEQHWESVYHTKQPDELSWFQTRPDLSCRIIEGLSVGADEPIIDVGGGASCLVDCLLDRGYTDITVLDIAPAALARSMARLADREEQVAWIAEDITNFNPTGRYRVWHDRAVFHFLTIAEDRAAYRSAMRKGLVPGGYLIVMSFAPDGPERCSGLDIVRYDADGLKQALGPDLDLLETHNHVHSTPWGSDQSFTCAVFRRT